MSDREGVDVASFQGEPGQWAREAGDIGWAAVKLTELYPDGTRYVNPGAAADWAWLKAQGKERVAYLFAHPGANPADTASFFIAELRKLGLEAADMVAVDLEVTDGRGPAEVAAWAREVTGYLHHDLARSPLLYTFLSFAEAGNCAGLGHLPLWMSDPSSPAGRPRVPAPWHDWAAHQYATTGAIDRDLTAWRTARAMAEHLGHGGLARKIITPEPRHRARKAARHVASGVKRAGHAVKRTVVTEPVLTAGGLAGSLTAAAAFLSQHAGLHLTATQMAAAVTILTGLAAIFAALRTRSVTASAAVPVITGALATISTAGAAFGLHVPAATLGTVVPFAAMAAGLWLRGHVSPKGSAAQPGSQMLPALTQRFEADFGHVHDALDKVIGHAERASAAVSAVPASPVLGLTLTGGTATAVSPPPAASPVTAPVTATIAAVPAVAVPSA